MQYKEYTTINRKELGWPSGVWDSEPDKVQWQDEETGLPCLAVRHYHNGHWCGYVGVDESHPMYGKDYDSPAVEVHGGLTYADLCQPGDDESTGVCHVPSDGEPEHVWWFGFDCAHAWDYSPSNVKDSQERGYPFTIMADAEYRTLGYVKEHCKHLAKQLVEMEA